MKGTTLKNIRFIIIILFLTAGLSLNSNALDKAKTSVVKIKTSAQCDQCKDRIEKALKDVKGIEKAVLNVDTKYLTVNFNPELIKADDIRKAITKIGYDADNMPASKKAYMKLPKCCKKGD